MRIVEYQPDTTVASCAILRMLGRGAAVLSLVIALLMIASHFTLKTADPIHSPALLRLLEDLKANPQNEALRQEIRELDYLARRAFFSSQHFQKLGTYLLLGSLVVMVVALKSLEAYQRRLPYPDPRAPKDDLAATAKWARQAITIAGLILVGFALSLALPWNSPLDQMTKPTPVSALAPLPAPTLLPHQPAAPAQPATAPVASRDEMLKHWPSFRGAASGHAQSTHLPIAWDGESGQGIAWKVAVPKPGFSSPIIWKDRVFLSGGDEESREVYCFDAITGALLWRHTVRDVPGAPAEPPEVTEDTGFAAPTMATDGLRVFAIFATGEIVALNLDGKRVWARALGVPENMFGHASSLVVFENTVLVQIDHRGKGGLYAFETATGETRWMSERDFGSSWSSPSLIEHAGSFQVILAASPPVISYDPRTGQELWRVDCLARGDVASAPVAAHGMVYVAGDHAAIAAIDLQKRTITWEKTELIPAVGTPVIAGDWLIYGLAEGGIVCLDARSGEEIWHQDTEEGFYASPLLAGNRVYLLDRGGVTHIFSPSGQFNLIGRPKLGEQTQSTPAVGGNSLFIRGAKNLYRIGS